MPKPPKTSSPAVATGPNRFAGKVVIITGSSSGIGQAIALRFAKEGASVTIHGQSQERLDETKNLLEKAGLPEDRILIVPGPVQDENTLERLINETVSKFGKLDILVNNAGVAQSGKDGNSAESFDTVFAVNVRAPYRLIQLATPHLAKSKGNIVNISSGLSVAPYPQAIPYSMTKAAVDHMTRNFAVLLSKQGIRVNSVNPGLTESNFAERHGVSKSDAKAMRKTVGEKTSLIGRPSVADEQAEVVLFVAADTSSYLTGAIIFNDGGVSIAHH